MSTLLDTRELTAFTSDLEASRNRLGRELDNEAGDAWDEMTELAKTNAPVDTGQLRRSLFTRVKRNADRIVTVDVATPADKRSVTVANVQEYWEHGTPFLRPAFDANVKNITDRLGRRLLKIIERAF